MSITCYIILDIISSVLLKSSRCHLYVYFRSICKLLFTETPSVKKTKISCEDSGIETTKGNSVRYRQRCSVGTLYSAKWLNFWTKYQIELFLVLHFSLFTADFWLCTVLWKQLNIGEQLTAFKSRVLFSCSWLSNVSINHLLPLWLLQPIFPLCTLFAELVRRHIVGFRRYVVRVYSFNILPSVLLVLFSWQVFILKRRLVKSGDNW